jgi:hypothetical protein
MSRSPTDWRFSETPRGGPNRAWDEAGGSQGFLRQLPDDSESGDFLERVPGRARRPRRPIRVQTVLRTGTHEPEDTRRLASRARVAWAGNAEEVWDRAGPARRAGKQRLELSRAPWARLAVIQPQHLRPPKDAGCGRACRAGVPRSRGTRTSNGIARAARERRQARVVREGQTRGVGGSSRREVFVLKGRHLSCLADVCRDGATYDSKY